MSTEGALLDNELFYEPEDGFWASIDKLEFESQNLQVEWPVPDNPFIRRMANLTIIERGQHNLALSDFKQLIGALVEDDPRAVYRFMLVPMGPSGRSHSIHLIEKVPIALPPIRADNACVFDIAVTWMSKHHSHFEMSCAADANFWMHKK